MNNKINKIKNFPIFSAIIFCLLIGAISAFAQTTPVTFNENVQAAKEAYAKSDFNSALKYYSAAIKLHPESYDVILSRAGVWAMLEKYNDSIKDLNTVLKANPENVVALNLRAGVYNAKRDWKKGFTDANAAIKINANNSDSYMARGLSLAGQKKYAEGEADLNTAIKLNPRRADYYHIRAAIYKDWGKANLAQADELKAAQIARGQ